MWLLMVSVIYLVNGSPHEQQFSRRDPIASQEECMTRGREAVERFARIDGVTGIAFVCAPAPTI